MIMKSKAIASFERLTSSETFGDKKAIVHALSGNVFSVSFYNDGEFTHSLIANDKLDAFKMAQEYVMIDLEFLQ